MLDELAVRNLGVIADARVDLSPGLVVVTGETGAGKTLLLGALRLLLGEQARRDRIGPDDDALAVEARLAVEGEERVVARRMTAAGRSRAYIDGAMVTAAALAETVGDQAEVVGQHDHLALATTEGVRRIVDGSLVDPGALTEYATAWQGLRALREEAALLGGDRRALERELETVRFQADEI
ncbi:MAG: AAA family ATPase, partial [Acidimicrobiia bacterium]|nr:AAA family ATPase [Acidimicrobiia bacterium]